jgi:hypothetical protein
MCVISLAVSRRRLTEMIGATASSSSPTRSGVELKNGPIGEIKTEEKEVVPVADVFSYVFDDGQLQSVDLKNKLKNVGVSFDNNLNKGYLWSDSGRDTH